MREEREDTLDVTGSPDLLRLAEEVNRTGRPRVLRRDGKKLAAIVPLQAKRARRLKPRELTPQDIADFESSAGGWRDFDLDRFLADIYASRDLPSDRPPVEL